MKKGMIGLSLALVIGLFSTFSYADGSLDGVNLYGDPIDEHSQPWGEDFMEYRENKLKRAIEVNLIKEEQAKTSEENYNYNFNKNNDNRRGYCSNNYKLNS